MVRPSTNVAKPKRVRYDRCTLGVFVKAPVPGAVKTRLCPPLTRQQAASLYAAFAEDTVGRLEAFARRRGFVLEVLRAPEGTAPPDWPRRGVRVRLQSGEGLFARMANFFEDALGGGARAAAVVGSDAPTLPLDRIEGAFEAIEAGFDGAIVPDEGGGYCVLALGRPAPILFEGFEPGTDRVLGETLERGARAGLRIEVLEGWYDVDRPKDLSRLREELARSPRSLAPRTRAALSALTLPEQASR
jgi:hypothetical protein